MIGHYLLTLDREAEGRVLMSVMGPGRYVDPVHGARCLVGAACDANVSAEKSIIYHPHFPDADYTGGVRDMVEDRYDRMCGRVGVAKANQLIRNRILSNQARRELTPAREGVAA